VEASWGFPLLPATKDHHQGDVLPVEKKFHFAPDEAI
jgi:hypothetical protein